MRHRPIRHVCTTLHVLVADTVPRNDSDYSDAGGIQRLVTKPSQIAKFRTFGASGSFVPSMREYFYFHGLDYAKLEAAKPDALIMHPGPMNRGVEIDSEVADDIDRSAIHEQVEMGVAVRMACLDLLVRNQTEPWGLNR